MKEKYVIVRMSTLGSITQSIKWVEEPQKLQVLAKDISECDGKIIGMIHTFFVLLP